MLNYVTWLSRVLEGNSKTFPTIYKNTYFKAREGKVSFQYDKWLSTKLLVVYMDTIQQPNIELQDY